MLGMSARERERMRGGGRGIIANVLVGVIAWHCSCLTSCSRHGNDGFVEEMVNACESRAEMLLARDHSGIHAVRFVAYLARILSKPVASL